MITLSNLSKIYGKRMLFSNLSVTINRGEKIGLVGPNGAGKTTLFSLILKLTEPSSGNVQIERGARIGYLPQESKFSSDRTVLSEVMEGDKDIRRLKKEKHDLELSNKADSHRYGEALHELEMLGYFEIEHKAKKILSGLGFKESDFNRPIGNLSGGWQMRTLLARLLTCRYDILLLDEPTNYLDLNAALWLKSYLEGFKGSFIMISHDREYLDDVASYTLVLENATISKIKGNYEHYLQIREEQGKHLLKKFEDQEKKKKQLQEFINRFHAQPNKASQVRSKKKVLERMEEIIVPPDIKNSIRKFHFPQTRQSGYQVINLENISKSYGDLEVYKDLSFEVAQHKKAVLVGDNGAGKSTLLKILSGSIDIDSGKRKLGYNVDVGYFSQTRMDVLDEHNTVLEEAYKTAGGNVKPEDLRTILAAFLFRGDDVEKSVSVLSGGEKSRLILAKLLIDPPNFLLLDEPTTHLDVDAVEALIKALKEYKGTLVFISHDIHFVNSIANTVFEVKSGEVREVPGDFHFYLEWKDKPGPIPITTKKKDVEAVKPYMNAQQRRSQEAQARKQEKEKKKVVNDNLGQRIKKLRKDKERIEAKKYAKQRVLERRDAIVDSALFKEYSKEIEKLDKKIEKIDKDLEGVKNQFK